jgi:4-amino-4-deoxy-L-arabinose transferase-like glycosyltransferase
MIAKIKNNFKKHQNKLLILIIAVLFLFYTFLLFYHLGVHPFLDWDESIYAQVARESLRNHQWLNFTYFGEHWFEKPPLGLWIISAGYALGGINEWSARIPTALSALGIVALSLRWVFEMRKSFSAVFLTMACYFIMSPFYATAYGISIDMPGALFGFIALYAWWKARRVEQSAERVQVWFLVWGVAIGLGVMTKSIVGLFPLVPIAVYELMHRDLRFLGRREVWQGVLASLLIALPWHIYQSIIFGHAFWDNYLFYHVLRRFGTNLENNGAPFGYFFDILFMRHNLSLGIFGGGVIGGVILSWKDRHIRFILLSAAIIFLIFSSSITKGPAYITLVIPLLVMMTGIVFAAIFKYLPKSWMRIVAIAILVLSFGYNSYENNNYKIAKGESLNSYSEHKNVGLFLKDYRRDLPVYIDHVVWIDYKNLAIGFYADRSVTPNQEKEMINNATEKIFHQLGEEVFLGKTAQGQEYIMIKKY